MFQNLRYIIISLFTCHCNCFVKILLHYM